MLSYHSKEPKVGVTDRRSQRAEYILLDKVEQTPCAHAYMLLESYPDFHWKCMYKDRYGGVSFRSKMCTN